MASKSMQTSLAIREMQIKTVMEYYLIPTKIAKIKGQTITSVDKNMEKKESSYTTSSED